MRSKQNTSSLETTQIEPIIGFQ